MFPAGQPHPESAPGRSSTAPAVARAPDAASRSPLRRAADAFSILCVAGALAAVSAAAAPSIARELAWTRASLSHRPWHDPSTDGAPSRNDPILVDPEVFEPVRPGARPPSTLDDEQDLDQAAPARFAVAVRDASVHASADDKSRSLAQVPRGELLLVIRQEGDWALVAHIADDGGLTGWVRSGDLAIR